MAKTRRTKEKSLTALFFSDLVVDKDYEEMELVCGLSIKTSGSPTTIAIEYMMREEWDEKDKLSKNFRGRIGVTSATPGGVDIFCGKLQCVTVTHRQSQVKFPSNS